MRFLFQIFLILLVSANVFGEEFCFRDSAEYEKYNDKMPLIFKKLPIVLGTDDKGVFFDVYVVLKIFIQNQAIVLNSDSWQGIGRYSDAGEVDRVCFNTKTKALVIVFTNNKEFKARYNENEVIVSGAVLKRISPFEQKTILNKINTKSKSNTEDFGVGQ